MSSHAQLLIIGFDKESAGTITSKVFEYMACRRPILALMPEGEASEMLQEYPFLYWVDKEDEDLLVEKIEALYREFGKRPSLTGKSDSAIIDTALAPFNGRNQTSRFAGYLNEVSLKR